MPFITHHQVNAETIYMYLDTLFCIFGTLIAALISINYEKY